MACGTKGLPIIGICPDDPAVTPPQFCQYDVGIPVESGVVEDEFISIQHLPELTLATLKITGSNSAGRKAWRWLISKWLPQSGLLRGHLDYYEVFTLSETPAAVSAMTTTLCVPVLTAEQSSVRYSSIWDTEV